jgi:hypothetical protein
MKHAWSRRDVSQMLLACLASVPVAGAAGTLLAQTKKAAKADVQYRDSPQDGKLCSGCMHFVPPSSCKLVEGDIGPRGWCALYTVKQG